MEEIFLQLVGRSSEKSIWDHDSVVLNFEEMVEQGLVRVTGHQGRNDVYFAIKYNQASLIFTAFEIFIFLNTLFVAFKNGLDYSIPTRDFSPFPTMFLNLPQSLLSFNSASEQMLFSSTG